MITKMLYFEIGVIIALIIIVFDIRLLVQILRAMYEENPHLQIMEFKRFALYGLILMAFSFIWGWPIVIVSEAVNLLKRRR